MLDGWVTLWNENSKAMPVKFYCEKYMVLPSLPYTPYMSLVVKKTHVFFCICENKDADQLRGNCESDQRLCFRYTGSTIPLPPKSEIFQAPSHLLSLYSTVYVGLGQGQHKPCCVTWSECQMTVSHTKAYILVCFSRNRFLFLSKS